MKPEFKTFEDLLQLNESYLKAYPDAEPLTSLLISYGIDGVFEIYAEANGRKIILKHGPGEDETDVSFQ